MKIVLNKIDNPEVIHASSLKILEKHTYFLPKKRQIFIPFYNWTFLLLPLYLL